MTVDNSDNNPEPAEGSNTDDAYIYPEPEPEPEISMTAPAPVTYNGEELPPPEEGIVRDVEV